MFNKTIAFIFSTIFIPDILITQVHPDIPEELSDRAHNFILRCFEPDPDKRATAQQLLEDSFLSEKKKNRTNTEYNRSISVPAERVVARLPGHSSAPNQSPSTPVSE